MNMLQTLVMNHIPTICIEANTLEIVTYDGDDENVNISTEDELTQLV